MADPTTVNKAATSVNAILKAVIEGATEPEIEALVLAESAGLVAIPVVGFIWTQVVKYFISYLGQYFYVNFADAMTKMIIDFQTNAEASDVSKAFSKTQDALKTGDQSKIDQATKELDDSYASLVHYDGSASA